MQKDGLELLPKTQVVDTGMRLVGEIDPAVGVQELASFIVYRSVDANSSEQNVLTPCELGGIYNEVHSMAKDGVESVGLKLVAAYATQSLVESDSVEAKEYQEVLKFSNVELYSGSKKVLVDGKEVGFTKMEYDLLEFMMRHPKIALSRERILDSVWGITPEMVGDRTVDVHIKRVREKMGKFDYIKAIRGFGYELDEYATLEYEPAELVVVIDGKAKELTSNRPTINLVSAEDLNYFQSNDIKLLLDRQMIIVRELPINLTLLQHNILRMLMDYNGRVCTYSLLNEELWKESRTGGFTNNHIKTSIAKLRRLFEMTGMIKSPIKSIEKVGYCWDMEVTKVLTPINNMNNNFVSE